MVANILPSGPPPPTPTLVKTSIFQNMVMLHITLIIMEIIYDIFFCFQNDGLVAQEFTALHVARPELFYKLIYGIFFFRFSVGWDEKK